MNESVPKQTFTDAFRLYMQYRAVRNTIERYCMFIGYPRSGHTLVRSVLDAHKNILIANECDALALFSKQMSVSRRKLYTTLIHNAQYHAKSGNNWTNFSYEIPGMYQGDFTTLKVIGDKKGGNTTLRLQEDSTLLDCLHETVKVPIVILHCIRNPYDNIATMAKKSGRDIDTVIQDYKERVAFIDMWEKNVPSFVQYKYVYHEALIENPKATLQSIFELLDVPIHKTYLKAVKKKIHKTPHKSSKEVQWTMQQKTAVQAIIRNSHFLDRYA